MKTIPRLATVIAVAALAAVQAGDLSFSADQSAVAQNQAEPKAKVKSGKYWVARANANAKNSPRVEDLAEPFRSNAKAFIQALENAGAKVRVTSTRRDPKRAYLFHWSW